MRAKFFLMRLTISNNFVNLEGELNINSVSEHEKVLRAKIENLDMPESYVDLSGVTRIDSSGVALLDDLVEHQKAKGRQLHLINARNSVKESLQTFSSLQIMQVSSVEKFPVLERIGDRAFKMWHEFTNLLFLVSDSFYFAVIKMFSRQGIRKGELTNQCMLIGMNAFPIVALIAFLIGFILALQSAAQLRQFGASIYIADLVSISMTREMGPIMTAIIFAGRSGSSIAAEIATMVVTEETDALRAMGLHPVRYNLVPKIHAITLMMPLLTVLAMVIGILGAFVIGITYLDIGIKPFYNQVVNALVSKDVLTGLVKSFVFAWLIVLTAAFYGFRVRGGAADVGRATTASVVTSIFLVILADSLLGLIFYFDTKSPI